MEIYYSNTGGSGPQGPVGPAGPAGADGAPGYSAETSFVVLGGSTGTQPTFNGAPLFSGTYLATGTVVHFQIQVEFDNILTFGTGQYYVDLPFPAKYAYQFKNGCIHDASSGRQYAIGGHVLPGASRLYLNYIGSNGQDQTFTHNAPFSLGVEDNFHISGDYIKED